MFECSLIRPVIYNISYFTENQVMSEGEDDLPTDVQPLPDPPSRYVVGYLPFLQQVFPLQKLGLNSLPSIYPFILGTEVYALFAFFWRGFMIVKMMGEGYFY